MMYVGTAFLPGWLVDLDVVLSDPLALVRCSGSLMRVQFGILAAVAAALLVPQAAEAASLAPLGACYRSLDSEKRETVPVWGMDFTPGEHVDVYTATATSRVTALALRLKPQRAAPSRRVRFIGSGFTDGPMVYAHYVRKGKHRKTVELGAPQGPCGRISAKRRQIPVKRPALGRWTLQVDNQPTYSAEPAGVFVRLAITVRRVARIGGY
jgi:hypothetical protein